MTLFAADDLTTKYSHVWVTLLKAEVVGPNGTVTLYDDVEGRTIDLTTLSGNGAARFALLAETEIPAGEYTAARFTFKNALSLVPTGGTEAVTRTFRGATGDTAVLPLTLTGALAGKCDLVADFDLSQWNDDGTSVSTVVRRHDGQGLADSARHERGELHGTISGLTGTEPEIQFTIVRGESEVKIVADAETVITSRDDATSPTLVDGADVEISGAFDPMVGAIRATSIKIGEDNNGSGQEDRDRVEGVPSSGSETGFTVTLRSCDGILPTSTTVNVAFADSTVYRSNRGLTLTRAEFLAALPDASRVEAEGRYDVASKTLTATSVRAEAREGDHGDGGGHVRQIEVEGKITGIDATSGTLTLTPSRWQGQSLPRGTTLSLVLGESTEFEGSLGDEELTQEKLVAALADPAVSETLRVEVRGSLAGTTVAVTRLKIKRERHDD